MFFVWVFANFSLLAQVAELVDALDSKSNSGNRVRVRFPPWAPPCYYYFMKKKVTYSLKPASGFFYTLLMVAGVVMVWRGVWHLLDVYLLPDSPFWSSVVSVIVGVFVLYLPDRNLTELE